MRTVKAYGGRFLRQDDNNVWYEISDVDARKKASQSKYLLDMILIDILRFRGFNIYSMTNVILHYYNPQYFVRKSGSKRDKYVSWEG